MKILRDIPISLTPEYVLEEMFRRKQRRPRAWMLEATAEAVQMSRALVAPAVIYAEFPVHEVAENRLLLALNGSAEPEIQILNIGPKVELLASAQQVLVYVATIGPALEQRVHQLQKEGDSLLSYMLDSVGVLALGAAGEALRSIVEEQAESLGWGVSPSLSPGSLAGWPLSGQRDLCGLLPLEEIDVTLNNHYVLEPHKSVSAMVGSGPGYESHRVGSVCHYCSLADSCWRRREEAA